MCDNRSQDQNYVTAPHLGSFAGNIMPPNINTPFNLPTTAIASLNQAAQAMMVQATGNSLTANGIGPPMHLNAVVGVSNTGSNLLNNGSFNGATGPPDESSSVNNNTNPGSNGSNGSINDNALHNASSSNNDFPFPSPPAPAKKDGKYHDTDVEVLDQETNTPFFYSSSQKIRGCYFLFAANPASSSSPSSDTSNNGPSCSNGGKSNGQNGNNWSFEEQYKQVRQVCPPSVKLICRDLLVKKQCVKFCLLIDWEPNSSALVGKPLFPYQLVSELKCRIFERFRGSVICDR